MTIVCGTDFSAASRQAIDVAAALALKLKRPLHLVHALDRLPPGEDPAHCALETYARSELQRLSQHLRGFGARVEGHVEVGPPDEVLRSLAAKLSASLIVLGALGQRGPGSCGLGSHADRTAERAHVPALVVREAAPFMSWLEGKRPLRITFGVDASVSAEAAARWIGELASVGRCEVALTHLYWPPAEFNRLGLGGVRSWVDRDPDITVALEREYAERFAGLFDVARVSYRLEPHLGRVGDAVAALADKEHSDLVVVGCHERGPLERVWEGSIARQVLRTANVSVACVPPPVSAPHIGAQGTPVLHDVLVATDFSDPGNAAVPLAYSVVSPGGTVHLVHVIKASVDPVEPHDIFIPRSDPQSPERQALQLELAALMPKDPNGISARTRFTCWSLQTSTAPSAKRRSAWVSICSASARMAGAAWLARYSAPSRAQSSRPARAPCCSPEPGKVEVSRPSQSHSLESL